MVPEIDVAPLGLAPFSDSNYKNLAPTEPHFENVTVEATPKLSP